MKRAGSTNPATGAFAACSSAAHVGALGLRLAANHVALSSGTSGRSRCTHSQSSAATARASASAAPVRIVRASEETDVNELTPPAWIGDPHASGLGPIGWLTAWLRG